MVRDGAGAGLELSTPEPVALDELKQVARNTMAAGTQLDAVARAVTHREVIERM